MMKNINLEDFGMQQRNPLLVSLIRHLEVQSEIYQANDDLHNLGWAILGLIHSNSKIENELLKGASKSLTKKIGHSLTSEVVIKFALWIRILKDRNKRLPRGMLRNLSYLFEELKNRNWMESTGTGSLLYFLLHDVDEFKEYTKTLSSWLDKKHKEYLNTRN
jgi:hypothetical protein